MANSTNTGNAGEYLVLAELLAHGHHADLAGRGNATFDIIIRVSGVRVPPPLPFFIK